MLVLLPELTAICQCLQPKTAAEGMQLAGCLEATKFHLHCKATVPQF